MAIAAISKPLEGKILNATTSLCAVCKQGVPAEIAEEGGRIVMRKHCRDHGSSRVLLSSDASWYHDTLSYPAALKAPAVVKKQVDGGCPFDCGACPSHEQSVYLPVIPITSACNLDCPICYTINKNDGAYHISLADFSRILEVMRRNDPERRIINLTGGEPTLHPQLREIIGLCHDAGIHRITLSTHGLTFLNDEALLRDLAALRTRMVLSFDSFSDGVNEKMIGGKRLTAKKMRVLDQFEKYDIDTTLIPVIALGVNDHELGDLIQFMLARRSIRSLEIHTMTFTGQSGADFNLNSRITTYDVLRRIEDGTSGRVRVSDFTPSPCAHPLCYQTCYLMETETGFVPFTRFMSKAQVRELLTDNLYMEPGEKMENVLRSVIDELWTRELPDDVSEGVLRAMKKTLSDLFPPQGLAYHEQQRVSERSAKTIYVHSHMDEHNFDTDRIRQCCVGVPEPDGGNTPTCSYNILYRGRDERFSKIKMKPLSDFGGGKKWG